jgi:thiosulfate/3-mercaptopyruvate sulfurtransferase
MRLLAIALLCAFAAAPAADNQTVQPSELAARLKTGAKPALIHVGFNVLYRNRHIPGSIYAGPGNTPAGLAALKAAAAKLPRDADIVVYCGCCPWDHCPNIKPSLEALRQMGFTKVKALYVPTNMAKDWFEPGYPSEAGEAAQK